MRKRIFSLLLAMVMVVSLVPTAVAEEYLCEHHTEHTEDCGYVEGVSDCAYHCDVCLGHSHGEEGTEPDSETEKPAVPETGAAGETPENAEEPFRKSTLTEPRSVICRIQQHLAS